MTPHAGSHFAVGPHQRLVNGRACCLSVCLCGSQLFFSFFPWGCGGDGKEATSLWLPDGAGGSAERTSWCWNPTRVLSCSPSPACASLEVCCGPTSRRMPLKGDSNTHSCCLGGKNAMHAWKDYWAFKVFFFIGRSALKITFLLQSIPAWRPLEKLQRATGKKLSFIWWWKSGGWGVGGLIGYICKDIKGDYKGGLQCKPHIF